MRRVFVKTSYMNLYLGLKDLFIIRSRFVFYIKDFIHKLGSHLCFGCVIPDIPLCFIIKFRKHAGISFNTIHEVYNGIMSLGCVCRDNDRLSCYVIKRITWYMKCFNFFSFYFQPFFNWEKHGICIVLCCVLKICGNATLGHW